eukprot:21691-Chlamydomonas_euryale.AAC.2
MACIAAAPRHVKWHASLPRQGVRHRKVCDIARCVTSQASRVAREDACAGRAIAVRDIACLALLRARLCSATAPTQMAHHRPQGGGTNQLNQLTGRGEPLTIASALRAAYLTARDHV